MSDEHASHRQTRTTQPALDTDTVSGSVLQRWIIVRHTTAWHPPTDVYEKDERLIVVVEIAGMRDSDFNVMLHGQRLVISGIRERVTGSDVAYHRLEIPFGEFRTEVNIPWSVQREEVSARYRDGFLRIELPHAPTQRIQIVTVDVENPADDDALGST